MPIRSMLERSCRRLALGLEADGGARAFVRATWVLMFAGGLAFVARYGSRLPHHDEYRHIVLLLTGQQDLSLSTLWQQHNQYRWPLPKLLIYLLLKLTGADFRSGMYVCVIGLGGLSAAMIVAARRLRGRTSYADALFPPLFLHWGLYENLLMGSQVCYLLPLVFACVILLIMLRDPRDGLSLGSAVLAGGCLLGLPLCGGSGVGMAPALAIWLGGMGVVSWSAPGPRRRETALVSLSFAAATLLVVALYFVGLQPAPEVPPSPGLRATVAHSLRCLAVGFGPGLEPFWPYSAAVVPALLLAGAGSSLARSIRDPRERPRAAGLVCLSAAVGCVALGVGWTRAGLGPHQAFEGRYGYFPLPAICALCLYLQSGSNKGIGELIQMSLFTLACLTLPTNMQFGKQEAAARHVALRNLEHDMAHGVAAPELAHRYANGIFWGQHEPELYQRFLDLKRAGVGRFRLMRTGPPGDRAPAPVIPREVRGAIPDRGAVRRR